MSTLAIDTYRLLSALKRTGKSANYSAEEIANAIHAAQEGTEVLTRTEFGVRMDSFEKRMDSFEKRMDSFEKRMDSFQAHIDAKIDAKIDATVATIRTEIGALRTELKSSQLQNLMWLSGIVLVSNGATVALLARLAHVI
jgi:septation ring formation regulator EzrA